MNFIEIFHEGGFIMYPLLFYSVLIWAVALKKIFFLSSFRRQYKNLHLSAMNIVNTNNLSELKWLFKNSSALISGPHEVLFEDSPHGQQSIKEKLHRRLSDTQAGLKESLWILGTIGSSAPFVGLFGTVMGIMDSFKSIGASGKSGFAVVAAGISESLIATAAGIVVAVVALLFYNYFQVKINNINRDFKNKLEDLADMISIAKSTRR